jgi:sulfonate transport system substrate-binding protein
MVTRRQALATFGVIGAGLALARTRTSFAVEPAKEFRIGWQKNGVLALAKSTGALEKRLADRGVSVTWSEFTSGPPLLEALGAGALDFGTAGDVPPLFAQAANGNLVYVAATLGTSAGSAILVKNSAPIKTLADLKGKILAFKRGSSAHNFVVKALRQAGLTLDDVTAVDLSPPDAAAAFATGKIDAWAIWDPYFAIAQKDPDTRILVTTEGIVDSWGYYFANGDFAKANPHVVADVVDELTKIGKWSQAHLDETITALADITGVPLDIEKVALTRKGADLGQLFPINDQALTYQQSLADEFFKLKIIPRQLTIKDIVWTPPSA